MLKLLAAGLAFVLHAVLFTAGDARADNATRAGLRAGNTELVILGGAAGRTSYGGEPTGGFSAAVVVGEDRYIVDFGRGWQERYYQAGLGTPKASSGFSGLEQLKAAFITHLHSDHTIDLPRLLLFGSTEGLRKRKDPVVIVGPGPRGELPPVSPKLKDKVQLVNPDNPTPGTTSMVQQLFGAYAADLNDNISDSGMPNPNIYIKTRDIKLPEGTPGSGVSVSPPMQPFEIYRDENIVVTATLVDHAPLYPAYAFRFDTAAGAIVFSGDTNKNENLIRLANGADVLVHEVISTRWANNLFPEPRSAADEAKLRHLLEAHTPTEQVGEVAARAGVKTLVLSHLAPPTVSDEEWTKGVTGFAGKLLIGRPLVRVKLN